VTSRVVIRPLAGYLALAAWSRPDGLIGVLTFRP
jgi:hypothetical protein